MEIHDPFRSREATGQVSGFVLAGGLSSRLGRDKVSLPWPPENGTGVTLLDHAIGRLQQVCSTVKVCAGHDRSDGLASEVPGHPHTIPKIFDAIANAGPLGGIVPALEQSSTDWNLFLAVDLPLVPVEFLRSLLDRGQNGVAGILSIVPVIADKPQPLCSLLHRSLAPTLRRALAEGKYKLMVAFENPATKSNIGPDTLDVWEVDRWSGLQERPLECSMADMFLNVNTPEEWARAQALASHIRTDFDYLQSNG